MIKVEPYLSYFNGTGYMYAINSFFTYRNCSDVHFPDEKSSKQTS